MTGTGPELSRDDLAATVAARRELGPEFEPALVDSLAERMETAIEARVQARLAQPQPVVPVGRPPKPVSPGMRLGLAFGSMGIGMFASGIAGMYAGLPGIIVTWSGIVLVNVTFALGSRPPRQ